jgi:hypothetical protein
LSSVSSYSRAGLHQGAPAHDDDGPDGDAEVEIAGEVEIADGAGVDAAPGGLERRNDLHRPDLRRARDRARRETCRQRVEAVAVRGQPAFDDRHQVHDVRVAFQRHVLRHPHSAELGHAPDVVAAQVDQHHVLGALLLAGLQFLRQALIVLGVRPSRPGTGDRVGLHAPALDPHQHLRGGADDGQLPHPQEEHVR